MKLLIEINRREFHFETHLAFVGYGKAFDRVKRYMLFEILQGQYISKLLLKSIVEVYFGKEIKIKIKNKLLVELLDNNELNALFLNVFISCCYP